MDQQKRRKSTLEQQQNQWGEMVVDIIFSLATTIFFNEGKLKT